MSERLTRMRDDLVEYLKKLGLDAETDDKGNIAATRRTALTQETTRVRVVETVPARPSKSVIYVLPDDSRETGDGERVFSFSAFLDRTVQADVISQQIVADPLFSRDLSSFVPQHIAVDGESQSDDAPHFVGKWLDRSEGGLLVVLAPAGYGKTVLMRVIAHKLARSHVDDGAHHSAFPFLIPFGDFRRVASFESMIVMALHRQGVTDVTAAAFAHLVKCRRAVLLLDGFDELLEERPEEARKNLREMIETLQGAGRVMITARSTFFRTSTDVADFLEHGVSADDVTIVDLRPFDAFQRKQLVQKLSPDQRTINYINAILEMEGVSEAMGSPLLLRETIEALADGDIRKKLSAHTKRSDLFTVLEASVYERERQRHGHRFPDRVQARFTERSAEEMLRANARGFDSDSINVVALEAASDFGFEAPESEFAQLADHHFLTVDHSSEVVRFNHQVFREYFQAKALSRAAREGSPWVKSVLQERPLPEEVARFLAELSGSDTEFAVICTAGGPATSTAGHYARNLALLCQAFGTRGAVKLLFDTVNADVPLDLTLEGVDLVEFDFGARMVGRLELVSCDLTNAVLSGLTLQEFLVARTTLDGAALAIGQPDILQVEYGAREFEPVKIALALTALGANVPMVDEEEGVEAQETWRDQVEDLVRSRIRRFHSGTAGGVHLWDTTISERNFFGGLGQVARHTTHQLLVPELVRQGVMTKHREHHIVVYRLTDSGKQDARRLLADDELEGTVAAVVDAMAPGLRPAAESRAR